MNLLTFVIASVSIAAHPLAWSDVNVILTSGENQLELPRKLPCSCQLGVFSVSNNTYLLLLSVQSPQTYSHVRVKLLPSEVCLVAGLDSNLSAVFDIKNTQYNGYEITTSFLVDFFTPQTVLEEHCEGIEGTGEERVVYLVNKMKEQTEGEYQYIINLPQKAIAVTQVLVFLLLMLLTRNIKYRRFSPFPFNAVFALLYAAFLFVIVYLEAHLDSSLLITFWVVLSLALICSTIYLIDLLLIWFSKMAAIVTVSVLISLCLGVVQVWILPDAWPVNNLIAVLVSGTAIKFIVIKKLRTAVPYLILLWFFFIFRQFAILLHFQNFEQALQQKLVPLFLQLPALLNDDQSGYICSAFGTSKIITMGLVLNYCVRIDLFLSTKFYTLLSSLTAFVSLGVEYLILVVAGEMPVMEYTSIIIFLPVSLGVILLFAGKRGEWAELWHGSFHDIAVDRKIIRRESGFDEGELDRYLDKLRTNPSSLITDY